MLKFETLTQSSRRALRINLIAQGILLLVSGASHPFLRMTLVIASLAYWCGTGFILMRRRQHPKPTDLFWMKYGLGICFALTLVIGPAVLFLEGKW